MFKDGEKALRYIAVAMGGLLALGSASVQANVTLDFESLCHNRAISSATGHYVERGFQLESSAFAAWGMYNRNAAGTAALFSVYDSDTTTFSAVNGQSFDFQSIDLSEAFRSGGFVPVTFVGHRADGSTVVDPTVLDGTFGFETHAFQGFDNLTSVTWQQNESYHQFDNISVAFTSRAQAAPVPGAVMLGVLGLGLVGFGRRKLVR